MIKFSLYREKASPCDRLICKRIDYRGQITILDDVNEFYDIVNNFLQSEYRIMIKGSSLYIFNRNTIFELLRFPEIINCNHLAKMRMSILTKISEEDLIPEKLKSNNNETNAQIGKNKSLILETFSYFKTAAKVLPVTIALVALMFTSFSAIETQNVDDTKDDIDSSLEEIDNYYTEYMTSSASLGSGILVGEEILNELILPSFNSSALDVPLESDEVLVEEPEISFEEKSMVVRQRDYLTKEMLDKLLLSMCDGTLNDVSFANSEEALDYLYENEERTYFEKMLIIMIREGISYEELDDICAGVRAEGGEYYDECYRVAIVGYNRYRSIDFTNYFGYGLYTQFLAKGQFSVFYGEKMYLDYKGCIDSVGYQAAIDMFYSRIRSTDYLSFRGWWVDVPYYWESFMYHGNQFGDHQLDSDIYKLEYEYVIEEELSQDNEITNSENMILERNIDNTY